MVPGVSAGRIRLIVVVVPLLLWTLPAGLASHHSWGYSLHAPSEGMVATGSIDGFPYNLTLGAPMERLAGHHEWREVIPVTWTGVGANHPFVLDAATGQYLGPGHFDSEEEPFLLGLPVLNMTFETGYSGGMPMGPYPLLPESVLWGRELFAGEHWIVPAAWRSGWDVDVVVTVADAGDVVVATVESTYTYSSGWGVVYSWALTVPWGGAVFPTQRFLTVGEFEAGGDVQWHAPREMPLQVTETGGAELPFLGASHVTFVARRDQTVSYGPVGFLPYDPSPDERFDVAEAAGLAWALDDPAVQAFQARADDPYLARAIASTTHASFMRWSLTFHEGGGNALMVQLRGIKIDGQPLVVADAAASAEPASSRPLSAAERAATEVAAFGETVDRVRGVVEASGSRLLGFLWEVEVAGSGVAARYTADHEPLLNHLGYYSTQGSVSSDAMTLVVTGSYEWEYGLEPLTQVLPLDPEEHLPF